MKTISVNQQQGGTFPFFFQKSTVNSSMDNLSSNGIYSNLRQSSGSNFFLNRKVSTWVLWKRYVCLCVCMGCNTDDRLFKSGATSFTQKAKSKLKYCPLKEIIKIDCLITQRKVHFWISIKWEVFVKSCSY